MAKTATFNCSKAVSVSSKYTANSYTGDRLAFGRGSADDEYRLLLDFSSVLGTIPKGATVDSATLKLTKRQGAIGSNNGFTVTAARITSAWSESSTWETGVAYSTTGTSTASTGEGHTGTISINVKSIVQAWVNGETQRGIMLRKASSGGTYIKVVADEGTANEPTLSVTYSFKASTFTTESTAALGQAGLGITITAQNSALTHTLKLAVGGETFPIATKQTAANLTKWNMPDNAMPNATSATGTLTLTTYEGSEEIGSTEKSIKVTAPSDAVPKVTGLTASIAGDSTVKKWGVYVQGFSSVKLDASGAEGARGSTIKSFKFSGDGWTKTNAVSNAASSTATSETLASTGTVKFTVTVTDSRGRTATKTVSITSLAYSKPTFSSASAVRANSDKTPNAAGGNILIKATAKCAAVGSNAVTVKAKVSSILTTATTVPSAGLLVTGASKTSQYTVTLTATDTLGGATERVLKVYTEARIQNVHKSGNGFAVGGFAEEGLFTSFLPAYFPEGIQPKTISASQLNDAIQTGPYRISGNSLTVGGYTASSWLIFAHRWNDSYCVQEMWPMVSGRYKVIRYLTNGTWVEEWDNPPMSMGVEYRTTERFDSNVVYAKLIDFGECPSSAGASLAHGISGCRPIRITGRTSKQVTTVPYVTTSGGRIDIGANSSAIVVRSTYDTSSYGNVYADLRYYKV